MTVAARAFLLVASLLLAATLARAETVRLEPGQDSYRLGRQLEMLADTAEGIAADVALAGTAGAWTPSASDNPSFGYARSEAWLRFKVRRDEHEAEKWLVVLRHPRTESFAVYRIAGGRPVPLGEVGIAVPWEAGRERTRLFTVPIRLPKHEEVEFLVRVSNRGPLHVGLNIETPEAYLRADQTQQFIFGLLFGVLIAVAIYGLIHWRAVRSPGSLWLFLFLVPLTAYLAIFSGFADLYLWQGSPDWNVGSGLVAVLLSLISGSIFATTFLELRTVAPWLYRVMIGYVAIVATFFVLLATNVWLTHRAIASAVVVGTILMVLAGVVSLRRDNRSDGRDYLAAWLILVSGALSRTLIDLRVLPPTPLAANYIYIAIAVAALFFAAAIAAQFRRRQAERSAALAESAERHALAVKGANDGIYEWDLVRGTVYASPRLIQILGIQPGDVEGRTGDWMKALDETDAARVPRKLRKFFGSRRDLFNLNFRIRRPDGNLRWIATRSAVVRNASGRVLRMAGSVSDVTERRSTLEALRKSESRYELAVMGSGAGLFDIDFDLSEAYYSPRLYEIFGITPAHLGADIDAWMDLIHPDDILDFRKAARAFMKGAEDRFRTEFRILRPDGSVGWIRHSAAVARDGAGRVRRMAGAAVDITEQRSAEEALRLSERRYALAARGSDAGLFEVDLVKRRAYYTPRFYEIWRRRPEEVGVRLDAFLRFAHPDDLPRALEQQNAFLASGRTSMTIDFRAVMPDGTVRWLRTAAAVERDEYGRPLRVAGATGDITEQKSLEQRLLQSQKMEALGQLAGGIAHDFNNVLSIIGGYATVLKRKTEAKGDLAEAAQRIQEGVERAASMTREMLTFSRRNPANARAVDLVRIVRSQGALLKPLLGADIRFEIAAADGVVPVRIDPNLLAQTIMNLAINARDAMPDGGGLRIALAREEGKAAIVVSDTGAGMDETTLGRIFEPFFTTKAPGKGTGLGLAMVYGIVTQFGGTIDVTSALGKGTTFALRFPITDEPIVEEAVEAVPARSVGGETILVAEDEAALLALVGKTLEEAGYVVLAAADGVDALEIADAAREEGRKIDLLLTDLVMPGLSGLKLAALIQELDPETAIVYMTGYPSRTGYAQGEIPKGATVLYKPLDLDRLLAGIAAALAARRRNAAAE